MTGYEISRLSREERNKQLVVVILSEKPVSQKLESMRELLDAGAFIDIPDFLGNTSLHQAALTASPDIVQYLLERGANPLLSNRDDQTAQAFTFFCKERARHIPSGENGGLAGLDPRNTSRMQRIIHMLQHAERRARKDPEMVREKEKHLVRVAEKVRQVQQERKQAARLNALYYFCISSLSAYALYAIYQSMMKMSREEVNEDSDL